MDKFMSASFTPLKLFSFLLVPALIFYLYIKRNVIQNEVG